MKKIVLALIVLVFAAPAWADVIITCAQVDDTNEVVISFNASGEANLVRAFSLNIQLDNDANIIGVGNVNADYYIHPGTIQIDTSTTPPTINYGTPVAEEADLPSDTLPGLGSNGVTIEMGSLYYPPDGPGSPNAPATSGALLSLYVSKSTCITINGNVARAGSSGVVMEDPDEVVDVNATTGCCVVIDTDPYAGTCWGAADCPGQTVGDATCDGKVNVMDVLKVKQSWLKNFGQAGFNQCADITRDCKVNVMDILKIKQNWLASGLGGNLTTVPPATCP